MDTQIKTKVSTGTKVATGIAISLGAIGLAAVIIPSVKPRLFPKPDITVTLTEPTDPLPFRADAEEYTITAVNTGSADATNVELTLNLTGTTGGIELDPHGIRNGNNCTISSTGLSATCTVSQILSGEVLTEYIAVKYPDVTFPCLTNGSTSATLTADPANTVAEKDETNNTSHTTTDLSGANGCSNFDTHVSILGVDTDSNGMVDVTEGGTISGEVVIHNHGTDTMNNVQVNFDVSPDGGTASINSLIFEPVDITLATAGCLVTNKLEAECGTTRILPLAAPDTQKANFSIKTQDMASLACGSSQEVTLSTNGGSGVSEEENISDNQQFASFEIFGVCP